MANKFKPVRLTRDGKFRTAQTATQETELRFEGWRTAPAEKSTDKPADAPKPSAPKN